MRWRMLASSTGTFRADGQRPSIPGSFGILDDGRSLIGALKLQRWDAVKWAVTVNVALAAAAAAFKDKESAWQLFWAALIMAVIGFMLMGYYNWRLKNARGDLNATKDQMAAFGVNFSDTTKPSTYKSFFYDWQELLIFFPLILAMSCVPNWLVWFLLKP